MNRARKWFGTALTAAITATVALSSVQAHAYDEDTHFYGTYAMARYSGIRHEVAMKIALSAQWMDESYLSDPTSMIVLPITGVKKRRLFHFPSSRVVGHVNAQSQMQVLGFDQESDLMKAVIAKISALTGFKGDINALNLFTETQEDHPFASELLMNGLKQGNLMMAAASLHTLEDSYAHAGTPAEQGHAAFWHWPDRPFASPEKYFQMVGTVFTALTAIRSQLPPEALDCSLRRTPGQNAAVPNCQLTAVELAQAYSNEKLVVAAVTHDYLKDPRYVKNALDDFFHRAVKAGYLAMSEEQISTAIQKTHVDGKIDAYQALENFMQTAVHDQLVLTTAVPMLNVDFILSDMGLRRKDSSVTLQDYVASYGTDPSGVLSADMQGIHNLLHAMAHDLLKWQVPEPLSDHHRMEIEDDASPIRKKEMDLRNSAMRELISQMFATRIRLVENNSKDLAGFTAEVRMDPTAEAVIPSDLKGDIPATFSLEEKNAWDQMVFTYLFPDMKSADLLAIADEMARTAQVQKDLTDYLAARAAINAGNQNWISKKASLLNLDRKYAHLSWDWARIASSIVGTLSPLVPTFFHDTVSTHEIPLEDDFFYRNPSLIAKYRTDGVIKVLMGEKDMWSSRAVLAATKPQP